AFYLLSQRADLKEMTVRTLRTMWHARININRAFRNSRTNHAFFLKILQSERFAVRTLAYMNRMGILGRYLPNFGRIVGQMQYDLFHQFTVDQHTLKVLENLHHFSRARYAHENPLCSHLMTGFSRQWVLYVAALFHDIAKGRGGDHSQLGMRDARRFCIQHDMTVEDTELVVFLVKEHLTLSTYAQKRDLSDPDVINAFARIVKDDRHLTALFLLTVADIQGTASNIWNAWKGKLMEDLLAQTKRVLGGEALSVDHELERRQQEAKAKLRLYGLPESAHDTFWKQLDIVYFLRNDASDIAWHTRSLYWQADAREPVVKCRLSQVGEGLQVMVYMPDRPDLFALICSYFDRKNYAILDAKIHTTKQQYALDSFIVTRQGFEKNYRDITSQVEHDLTEILKSSSPLPEPSQPKLSRKSRIFPVTPSIDLRPDAGGRFVLSITGNDYRGLLYAIAWVFSRHRINLHTAKIMTLGERIEDVFLIDGETLLQPRLQIQFERDMIDVLRTPAG
ncbi:MAG: HD domain-containing protein, partial [Oxalobacter sp.]